MTTPSSQEREEIRSEVARALIRFWRRHRHWISDTFDVAVILWIVSGAVQAVWGLFS